MKAFTDIEQSRKLAEILPIESADMRYAPFGDTHPWFWDGNLLEKGAIPCWSLAALLEALPHYIDDRHGFVSGKLSANEDWYICYDDNGDIDYYVHNSSLINACYEMILKLHEQKVL